MVEQRFVDTYELSVQEGRPSSSRGRPGRLPSAMSSLAPGRPDWSPDFPTVAQKAVELPRHRGRRTHRRRHRHDDIRGRPTLGSSAGSICLVRRLGGRRMTLALLAATRTEASSKPRVWTAGLESVDRCSPAAGALGRAVTALDDISQRHAWPGWRPRQVLIDEAAGRARGAGPGDYLYVVRRTSRRRPSTSW
jgi:hypothetical protein